MRYIKKGHEPQSFTDWKAKENDDWKPTYDNLQGQEKLDVHKALLEEQGYTCCYCGISIIKDISHIEHLHPQNSQDSNQPKDLELALQFSNLLASCGFSEGYKISDPNYNDVLHCLKHCGCRRGNNSLAISPLQVDCAEFFRYPYDGGDDVEIRPVEDTDKKQFAAHTIKTLNLNETRLMAMRGGAVKGALQVTEGLTQEEIALFIKSYEQPNQQAFSFAIIYILKQYL